MSDETTDHFAALREKVEKDQARLRNTLAPLYIGRRCPLLDRECLGPDCMLFLPTGDGNKITSGACSIPLAVSQLGPLMDALTQTAQVAARGAGDVNRIVTGH